MRVKILSTLLLLSFSYSVFAQFEHIKFEHITSKDGLINNTVSYIFKDKQGFMWFSTIEGFSCYDGYNFKTYNYTFNVINGIHPVKSIVEDHQDNLWIGLNDALLKFNKKTEIFTIYNNKVFSHINTIKCGQFNNLWIATYSGLIKFNTISNETKRYENISQKANSIVTDSVLSLTIDSEYIYLLLHNNFQTFNIEKESFSKNIEYGILTSKNTYPSITKSKSGTVYLIDNNALCSYNSNKNRLNLLNNHFIKNGEFNGLAIEDVYSNSTDIILLILTHKKGFIIWNEQTGDYKYLSNSSYDNISMGNNSILSRYIDFDGIVWISTISGIYKYDTFAKQFNHIKHHNNTTNSLSNSYITSVYEGQNNKVWISTRHGLNYWDREKDIFTHFLHNDNPKSISYNRVKKVIETRDKTIWCGTLNLEKLTNFYKKGDKNFIHYKDVNSDTNSLKGVVVWDIIEDKSGNIWASTMESLNLLTRDEVNAKFPYFKNFNFGDNEVRCIYEGSNGLIWLGTDNGLKSINPLTWKVASYQHSQNSKNSITKGSIKTIHENNYGDLWIGTEGGGICKLEFNNEDKSVKYNTFTTEQGLAHNVVWGILEDNNQNLWISTSNGLSKFNTTTKIFRNFYFNDGLQDNQFTYQAYFKNKKGEMYFGGINGLNYFYPDSIKDNPFQATPIISELKIFNIPVKIGDTLNGDIILKQSVVTTKKIKLSYNNNNFTLKILALHFANSNKNRLSYMMEGYDKAWITTDQGIENITYTGLPVGKYNFKVKASNCDKIWNSEEATLVIVIYPPWWNTWWFKLTLILLLIITLTTVYLLRITSIKKRNRELEDTVTQRTAEITAQNEEIQTQAETLSVNNIELEKLNATKDKFFSIIAHDLKNPFHAISSLSGLMSNEFMTMSDPQKIEFIHLIQESSKGASNLLDNLLQWANTQTNKIIFKPTIFDINEVANTCLTLMQINAKNKQIKINIRVKKESVVYADKDMITTVIRNLLSNAIKFTPNKGEINILQKQSGENMSILIEDDGVGMSDDTIEKLFEVGKNQTSVGTSGEQGTGIGLILCKEFMEKNNGTIEVISKQDKGSTFIIKLPSNIKHYEIYKKNKIIAKDIIEDKIITTQPMLKAVKIKTSTMNIEELNGDKPFVLIVDDKIEIRTSLRETLKGQYKISEAENGAEGLKIAYNDMPNLIISDIVMPKMNGVELCRTLKLDERTSHIPVILLSTKSRIEDRIIGLETGADDYITKPFEAVLIKARVENLINSRAKLRAKFSHDIFATAKNITPSGIDKEFLQKAINIIEDNAIEPDFTVDSFANKLGLSRRQAYRKIHALSNQSINDFILTIKLNLTAREIKQKELSISEIAYKYGFSRPNYFSKCFKKQFNQTPTEYLKYVD